VELDDEQREELMALPPAARMTRFRAIQAQQIREAEEAALQQTREGS
jgi:hypothetical protein